MCNYKSGKLTIRSWMLRDNENGTSKNENHVINDKVTIYKYHYMRE